MFRGHITAPAPTEVKTVTLEIIPHSKQRYPTTGDWIWNPSQGELRIRVSRTEDWREALAVGVHEIVEAILCIQDGVDADLVDSFDMFFENHRAENDDSEPGDDPRAPYYEQHQVATNVEHVLTTALGLHWDTYNANLGQLYDDHPSVSVPHLPTPVGGDSSGEHLGK